MKRTPSHFVLACNTLGKLSKRDHLRHSREGDEIGMLYTSEQGAKQLHPFGVATRDATEGVTGTDYVMGKHTHEIDPRAMIEKSLNRATKQHYKHWLKTNIDVMRHTLQGVPELDTPASLAQIEAAKAEEVAAPTLSAIELVRNLQASGDIAVVPATESTPISVLASLEGGLALRKLDIRSNPITAIGQKFLAAYDLTDFPRRVTLNALLNHDKQSEIADKAVEQGQDNKEEMIVLLASVAPPPSVEQSKGKMRA